VREELNGLRDSSRFFAPSRTPFFSTRHATTAANSFFILHPSAFILILIPMPLPWDLSALGVAPQIYPASGFHEPGVQALFFDGPAYQGKPTRVFAWVGFPENATGRVPGMVLVHGGGGSAFAEWVRLWTSRGYAAIAMDLNGRVPIKSGARWTPHEHAGPAGIPRYVDEKTDRNSFSDPPDPIGDSWPYHAVAAVLLSHSLLRSFPNVDPNRIGLTGISWGGWLAALVSGVDHRFAAASPVYGCGFIHEGSKWLELGSLDPRRDRVWVERWEPSHYLPNAKLPMLWINGTNDFAYWPPAWRNSSRLPRGPRTLCMKLRMVHGHDGPGERPPEIHAFMDHHLRDGPALASVLRQGEDAGVAWADFSPPGDGAIARAELLYTGGTNRVWPERPWETAPAAIDSTTGRCTAVLPAGVTAYVLNAIDIAERVVSAEPVFRDDTT
jgi:dienelactone hydrolase